MPESKLNPKELDWAQKVYKTLHWKFPAHPGQSPGSKSSRSKQRSEATHQATPEPDLQEEVQEAASEQHQAKKRSSSGPIRAVFEELGLEQTDGFRERLETFSEKRQSFKRDPIGTAYTDPDAQTWKRHITGTLGMSQDKADQMAKMQFQKKINIESRGLTREILETQSGNPKFKEFLHDTAEKNPDQISDDQKEMLIFISRNIVELANNVVHDVNDLFKQHAFGKSMTDTIEEAKSHAVTTAEKKRLHDLEEEVIAYRMAVAKQLGNALNTNNDIMAAKSFGDAADLPSEDVLEENTKAQNAVAGIGKMADKLVRRHLAKSNSPNKTKKWIATQPWSNLVNVEINTEGEYFNISTDLRPPANPDATINSDPELLFHGLRSKEMMQALTTRPTGERGPEGEVVVERPSDMAMDWGQSLADAQAAGKDISDQLPDYAELKQVQYHDIKKGFFKTTDRIKTVWIVDYRDHSNTIAEVNMRKQIPQKIAGNLADLTDNLTDLRQDQAENMEKIADQKAKFDRFLSTKGDGLFRSFGNAHEVLTKLRDHALSSVVKKFESSGNLKKVEKWIKEQSWTPMFDITFTPMEGKKDAYNIGIVGKGENDTDPENTSATLNADEINAGAESEDDQMPGPEELSGLSGPLRALLSPAVRNQLITKPTGETVKGVEIYEEPGKLAHEWAELLLKTGGTNTELPDYLELREIHYLEDATLFWKFKKKKRKVKSCWVLEFKPSAFKKET